MEALLKMMGINPDEIKKQMAEASSKFNGVIDHFNNRMNTIESKIDSIINHLNIKE